MHFRVDTALHYTAAYAKTERDRPDPTLVAFYKGWIDRVSALTMPELWNTCIDWRSAQIQLADARWNARSYPAREVWKPSAVSALLASQDTASAREMVQTLRANAADFGERVASQPAWRQNDRQNIAHARGRMAGALDGVSNMWNDMERSNCEIQRENALRDANRAPFAPDCEKSFPSRR